MTTTYLYRAKDEAGVVLYVGITGNPKQRQDTHAYTSPWRELSVPSLEWLEFDTRQEAAAFEKAEIARLKPKFNKAGNPDFVTLRSDDLVSINVFVPPEVRIAWKKLAIDRGVSLQKLIVEAVNQ